jgi:ABC-type sugar transport system ATPase subunit
MSCLKNPSSSILSTETKVDSSYILDIENLSKLFSVKENSGGLEELNFNISPGRIAAIIGESGSGKSTLLKLIYGLIKVDKGMVRFYGERVKGPDEKLIPGHESMRMVSQHFDDLNTYANVWDNVASRLSNTDLSDKEYRTNRILKRLKISKLKDQRIADLSGGEKQRVAIARALVTEPLLLLMDEPFNQIDSAFRDQLQSDIRHIVDETGLTVILVSHDPAEVMGLADYIIILQNGIISAKGSPYELYQNPPNSYVAKMLSKSNVLSAEHALALGLANQQIAIHPEWIRVVPSPIGDFYIERVIYRGFYEEVIVKNNILKLRIYQMANGQLKNGDTINLDISRFVKI